MNIVCWRAQINNDVAHISEDVTRHCKAVLSSVKIDSELALGSIQDKNQSLADAL